MLWESQSAERRQALTVSTEYRWGQSSKGALRWSLGTTLRKDALTVPRTDQEGQHKDLDIGYLKSRPSRVIA